MIDPTAFARLLCGYCLDAQPEQQVVVHSTTLAAPLLLAVQRELLERGAWPLLRTELPGAAEDWWTAAREAHLDSFPPAELAEAEHTDASLTIQAPENTTALAAVDPARMARAHEPGDPALVRKTPTSVPTTSLPWNTTTSLTGASGRLPDRSAHDVPPAVDSKTQSSVMKVISRSTS